MKRLIFLVVSITILFEVGYSQSAITSMKPIMEMGYQFVNEIEKQMGSNAIVQRAEFDFAFDDNFSYVDVSPELKYVIAALGDEQINDISLMVYRKVNNQWTLLAQDNENSPKALVEFTPSKQEEYAIDVRVNSYKNTQKIGHVATFILVTKK
ncbi:MAG: hypothetical protein NZM38_09110 [Cytophagales bacterium]|nr:hypothetical protein [Cytophagales bacterium]MDW8384917.1 hypothetical protein [Flammeovirgaceae bacterium]